jgi:AraC-like DNA-binding protein
MKRKINSLQRYRTSHITPHKLNALWWKLHEILESKNQIWQFPPNILQLCKSLDTNQKYLSQTINQSTGLSITSFFHCYRIEAFLKKIAQGEAKLKTIEGLLTEVGFQNRSSFYKAFRSTVGTHPKTLMAHISDEE